jgi:hypothetical protein
MRRPVVLTMAVVVTVGVLALALHGATAKRPFAQTLGVSVATSVAPLRPGDEACQGPIALASTTSAITFNPGTPKAEPGPRIDVSVRAAGTRRVLATATVPQGFDPRIPQTVHTAPVPKDTFVDVCFRNASRRGTALLFGDQYTGVYGSGIAGVNPTITTSSAKLNGNDLAGDIAVVFPYAHPRSETSLLPAMFERASLWRPSWVGPWVYWTLLALLVIGAPVLLTRALLSAVRADAEA